VPSVTVLPCEGPASHPPRGLARALGVRSVAMASLRCSLQTILGRRRQPARLAFALPVVLVLARCPALSLFWLVVVPCFVQLGWPTLLGWLAVFLPSSLVLLGLFSPSGSWYWVAGTLGVPWLVAAWLLRPLPLEPSQEHPMAATSGSAWRHALALLAIGVLAAIGFASSSSSLSRCEHSALHRAVKSATEFAPDHDPRSVHVLAICQLKAGSLVALPTPWGRATIYRSCVRPAERTEPYPVAWSGFCSTAAPFLATCHWGWLDGVSAGEFHHQSYFCLFGCVVPGPYQVEGGC